MSPTLVLVCGLPGAGKTTLARELESTLPAVRFCPDEWMADLGVDLWDETFRERLEARLWLQAQEFLRAGVNVVLESGFWSESDRDEKRLAARALGARVELRLLDPAEEVLWERLARRGPPFTRELLGRWGAAFERPGPEERALFDA